MRLISVVPCVALVLVAGGFAHGHGGYESEAEARLYTDRMRIVTRTSLPFAWKMLGQSAPATGDEAGRAEAKPLLAAAAAGLFEVTDDGKPLAPVKSDCVFEVHDLHDHAVFVLEYPRPAGPAVVVKALYFPKLGELDAGSIAVFDHTAAPFRRDIEPLVKRGISRQSPEVGFTVDPARRAKPVDEESPGPPPVAAGQVSEPGSPGGGSSGRSGIFPRAVVLVLLLVAAVAGAWRWKRGREE